MSDPGQQETNSDLASESTDQKVDIAQEKSEEVEKD